MFQRQGTTTQTYQGHTPTVHSDCTYFLGSHWPDKQLGALRQQQASLRVGEGRGEGGRERHTETHAGAITGSQSTQCTTHYTAPAATGQGHRMNRAPSINSTRAGVGFLDLPHCSELQPRMRRDTTQSSRSHGPRVEREGRWASWVLLEGETPAPRRAEGVRWYDWPRAKDSPRYLQWGPCSASEPQNPLRPHPVPWEGPGESCLSSLSRRDTLTIGVLYLWLTTSLISGTKTGQARDKTESSPLRATQPGTPPGASARHQASFPSPRALSRRRQLWRLRWAEATLEDSVQPRPLC